MSAMFKHRRLVYDAAKPVVSAADKEQGLADILQLPPIPGRIIGASIDVAKRDTTSHDHVWSVRLEDKSQSLFIANVSCALTFTVDFGWIPQDQAGDAHSFMEALRAVFLAWPWPVFPTESTPGLQALIVSYVLERLGHKFSMDLLDVTATPEAYRILVPWLNSKTGEYVEKEIHFSPRDATSTKLIVPGPPLDYHVRRNKTNPAKPLSQWDSWYLDKPAKLPDDTTDKLLHTAQDALRWLAAQLCGLVVTAERFEKLLSGYQAHIGMLDEHGCHSHDVYGGKRLYDLSKDEDSTCLRLTLSPYVLAEMSLTQTPIIINSIDSARAMPVLDTLLQSYQAGAEFYGALTETAITADAVNDAIRKDLPSDVSCACNSMDAQHTYHACQECAGPTICSTRVSDGQGRRICRSCSQSA